MDAAHKLFSHTRFALLLALALTLSAPVWAQPSFSLDTSTVTCTGTSCPPGVVNVTSTGAQITYTVAAPDYSQDTGTNSTWLVVNPIGAGQTTPGQINFSLGQTSGLIQGTHTALVKLTATSPAGVNPATATITVTFNTGS